MAKVAKVSVRLLALILFVYFILKIVLAVNKLQDAKVGIATTRRYERARFLPSLSICYRKNNIYNTSNPEIALNMSRYMCTTLLKIKLFMQFLYCCQE